MMKILVVHDRISVAEKISESCSKICKCSVEFAEDARTARQKLQNCHYDLLILDLTIPHRKGQTIDYAQASNLISDIYSDEEYPPADIIGVTNDEKAYKAIYNGDLKDNKILKVVFEKDGDDWLSSITQTISYLQRTAESRIRARSAHYEIDVLLISAMDEEFIPLNETLELTDEKGLSHVYNFIFNDSLNTVRRGIAASVGKQGQEASASFSQSLISRYRPKLVVMVGICGGVKERVDLGDAVVFESVVNWDAGKYREASGAPDGKQPPAWLYARPEPVSMDGSKVHDFVRTLTRDWTDEKEKIVKFAASGSQGKSKDFKLHLKTAASGSSVVAAEEIVQRIRGLNDNVHAVDMESYGLYLAASRTLVAKPNFVCVKGVSDFCDAKKADDYHVAAAWASWAVGHHIMVNWAGY